MADVIHKGWIRRGEPEYDEVLRALGPSLCHEIADERVRQINNRWLKADMFIRNSSGDYLVINDEYIATRSQRIRIPKGSSLRGRTHG